MDLFLYGWFFSLAVCLSYVIWHNVLYNPVSWVQKLAWILVTAYTGVFGSVKIRATNIFRKEGGVWKMITHQTDPLAFLNK